MSVGAFVALRSPPNVTLPRVNLAKHSAFQMKEVFLLCACQSVSEGLREHSVLPLCVYVCVEVGGGAWIGRGSRGVL